MILGRIVRFGVVGVINTGVYYALYLLLQTTLPYLVAHVCAFVLAIVGSYFLNCYFTFRIQPSWRTFFLFPLSNAANFAITTVGLYVLVQHAGMDERVAAIPAAAVAIPITFLVAQFTLTSGSRHRNDGPAAGASSEPSTQRTG
ncbi:MAG: GtrA family protein [Nocardioidaceae bacterium]